MPPPKAESKDEAQSVLGAAAHSGAKTPIGLGNKSHQSKLNTQYIVHTYFILFYFCSANLHIGYH